MPTKMGTPPHYAYPIPSPGTAEVADALGISGKNDKEKLEHLIDAMMSLKKVGSQKTIIRMRG